jgi:hypothetical protein
VCGLSANDVRTPIPTPCFYRHHRQHVATEPRPPLAGFESTKAILLVVRIIVHRIPLQSITQTIPSARPSFTSLLSSYFLDSAASMNYTTHTTMSNAAVWLRCVVVTRTYIPRHVQTSSTRLATGHCVTSAIMSACPLAQAATICKTLIMPPTVSEQHPIMSPTSTTVERGRERAGTRLGKRATVLKAPQLIASRIT